MKNLNTYISESQEISGGPYNKKIYDLLDQYCGLSSKPTGEYESYEEMVDEIKGKLESVIYSMTNEYAQGYKCGALYEYFTDKKVLDLLKQKSDEDKEEFEKFEKLRKNK